MAQCHLTIRIINPLARIYPLEVCFTRAQRNFSWHKSIQKKKRNKMLDINLLRVDKGGNPELVKESQRKRGASVELIDEIIELDKEWVKLDECGKELNSVQKKIAEKMKAKEEAGDLLEEKKTIEKKRSEAEIIMNEKEQALRSKLSTVGNIVHESVVASKNEDDNNVVRKWPLNKEPEKLECLSHDQVLKRLDGYEPERGANVAGHRGYFLKNWGLRLNQAMINYGLDFLSKREYTLLQTPFMMRRELMAKAAQLEEFDEQLYKITVQGEEDKYLIATSEQPITAFHQNEWFENPSEQLPIKYGGYSSCFRKEAGAHGKDTWGIFRVHQFEKVEQFCLTEPEKSWEMFDEMIKTSEEFFQSLGISYRIVGIVSGALNNAAAKKYDLEAWFPSYGQYKELVSCSNCTDYQSRRMEIRCGTKKLGDREKKYVHCLNSTLCATERALCCILENYQTKDGLNVPEKLRPYLGGVDFIPFTVAAKK